MGLLYQSSAKVVIPFWAMRAPRVGPWRLLPETHDLTDISAFISIAQTQLWSLLQLETRTPPKMAGIITLWEGRKGGRREREVNQSKIQLVKVNSRSLTLHHKREVRPSVVALHKS